VAENRLRAAVSTNPNDYQSLIDLGNYSYTCTKDFASAISAYSQAAKYADNPLNKVQDEDWMQVHIILGLSFFSKRDFDMAANHFQTVLDKQPTNPDALMWLGAAKYAQNPRQPQIALAYWQKVIQQNPTSEAAQRAQQLIDSLTASGTATTPKATATSR
jgi:cytochrome c-type biogenesis protein CcmH/NrfG